MNQDYNESNLALIKVWNNHLCLEKTHWVWVFVQKMQRLTVGWDPWEGKGTLGSKYKWED